MSQHDLTIANQGFPAFRSDLNNALQALGSTQAGSSAPSPTFAHQMWIDTSSAPNVLKIRNADNDAWITVGQLNQTADTFNLAVAQGGTGASTNSGARTNLGLGSIATQAANNVTITGGSITGITDLVVADGGTGRSSLTAENVLLGDGTNAVKFVAPGASGNVLTSNGTTWTSAPKSKFFRTRLLTSGTTYNKPLDVKELYVFVCGSTGGKTNNQIQGGTGGAGYAEKYYSSPTSSYTYAIGAGGTTSGTQGGTTSWDSGSVSVTGSDGITSSTNGSAGGVGSNGDFNASGGTGGTAANNAGGGGGGAGSRAGNGGNGGNGQSGPLGGGGGGSGGNNASGGTGGAAATSASGSAIAIPFGQITETFATGSAGSGTSGGLGAGAAVTFDAANPGINLSIFSGLTNRAIGGNNNGSPVAGTGSNGRIVIVEVCE